MLGPNSFQHFKLEELFATILKEMDDIGVVKAVGYLPLDALRKLPEFSELKISEYCASRRLQFRVFTVEECCIRSGVVFFWSERQLNELILKFSECLKANNIAPTAEDVISNLAKIWYPPNHNLMPFIRKAFGDD